MKTDSEGYILLEKQFSFRGNNYQRVKDFDDGWYIYEVSKPNLVTKIYELIFSRRQESFKIGGNIVPKKYSYPSDSQFGHYGFCYFKLEDAVKKYNKLLREAKEKTVEKIINWPKENFIIKDVLTLNPTSSYIEIYVKIKELVDLNKIKIVGEQKNKIGKPSKIYCFT